MHEYVVYVYVCVYMCVMRNVICICVLYMCVFGVCACVCYERVYVCCACAGVCNVVNVCEKVKENLAGVSTVFLL